MFNIASTQEAKVISTMRSKFRRGPIAGSAAVNIYNLNAGDMV